MIPKNQYMLILVFQVSEKTGNNIKYVYLHIAFKTPELS